MNPKDPTRSAILQRLSDYEAHIKELQRKIEALEQVLPEFPDPVCIIQGMAMQQIGAQME